MKTQYSRYAPTSVGAAVGAEGTPRAVGAAEGAEGTPRAVGVAVGAEGTHVHLQKVQQ